MGVAEFFDEGNKIVGSEIDMAAALGIILGVSAVIIMSTRRSA